MTTNDAIQQICNLLGDAYKDTFETDALNEFKKELFLVSEQVQNLCIEAVLNNDYDKYQQLKIKVPDLVKESSAITIGNASPAVKTGNITGALSIVKAYMVYDSNNYTFIKIKKINKDIFQNAYYSRSYANEYPYFVDGNSWTFMLIPIMTTAITVKFIYLSGFPSLYGTTLLTFSDDIIASAIANAVTTISKARLLG